MAGCRSAASISPDQWDEHFTPIIACNDPGEAPLKGGILVGEIWPRVFCVHQPGLVPRTSRWGAGGVSAVCKFVVAGKRMSVFHFRPHAMADSIGDPQPLDADDEITDLPGLRTWPAVYAFVLGTFLVWVSCLPRFRGRFRERTRLCRAGGHDFGYRLLRHLDTRHRRIVQHLSQRRRAKHAGSRIGVSVMATQASAITFLSTPGQGIRKRAGVRAESTSACRLRW